MAEQDADRSEQATQHKLDEARGKGSVAKSIDFNATAILGALLVSLYGSGWDGMVDVARVQQRLLAHMGRRDWSSDGVAVWMGQLGLDMLQLLAPLMLVLAIAAVLVNLAQTGAILSFHPLVPDPERINPAAGFKRLFSMRTLFDTCKSVFKLLVLSAVAYIQIRDAIPGLVALQGYDPKGYVRVLLALAGGLLAKLVLTFFVLATLDLIYTRWEYAKRMRMSMRDIKDESKNREGDPRIRSRIRALRQEMLKRSAAVRKLPSADVLITNPTHLAVALCYQHGTSAAPQVVAKGAGELARKMREIAARERIPVVQNKALARALFREVDYDGYVPETLYPQVAKIMVWVYTMRAAKRAPGKAV